MKNKLIDTAFYTWIVVAVIGIMCSGFMVVKCEIDKQKLMAKRNFLVSVTRTSEYEVQVDDTLWTDEALEAWSDAFSKVEDVGDIAVFVATEIAHRGLDEACLEGVGFVERGVNTETGFVARDLTLFNGLPVPQEKYNPSFRVEIIEHDKFNTTVQTIRTCRECGCTDGNCINCIRKTGEPCYWIERDLCSACKLKYS